MSAPISKSSQALEAKIRLMALDPKWGATHPLPPVRDLAREYQVSHTTPYRILGKLCREGIVWQHSNGRFFQVAARDWLEKKLPAACLLRHLETWSACYQSVMRGFSKACGLQRIGMLFIHNDQLIQHSDITNPPNFGDAASQIQALTDFFKTQSSLVGGILLDDIWQDAILQKFEDRLHHAVIVNRPTSLPFLSSIMPDHAMGGMLSIAHLLARGYQEIWIAIPFKNYIPVEQAVRSILDSARTVGYPISPTHIHHTASPKEQLVLVDKIKHAKKRIGLICIEDNVTTLLLDLLRAQGLSLPDQVGLLSAMGSWIANKRHLSSVQMNYEEVGRKAAEVLRSGSIQTLRLPVQLVQGETT